MTNKNLQFKVSAALKSIIGKDLITNKYIAIFELVKNSFDAYADKSEILFEEDRIIIKDDGKGMSLDDLKNKWLFVAYSAKADETENQSYKDYRKKIKKRDAFAGAKGVGRFACDRLGKKLNLITIKEGSNVVESLEVFWESFEENPKDNFIDIEVKHSKLRKNPYPEIKHGTVLEITELRESWSEGDIERLKKHLAKLINPVHNQGDDNFTIELLYKDEKSVIANFIFEKLALKTTQISVKIPKGGKYISTELIDRGEQIYKIKEKNPWSNSLQDIDVQLFYISTPTKIMFKHLMGVPSVQFGSVFLYKNGFRVFPFGEEGDDSLHLDRRKQQGYARFLGTRELIGFISINSKGDDFKETSSRDGGLIQTPAYEDLEDFFLKKSLRRLETYVVDTLSWTYKANKEISPQNRKTEITALVKRLTDSDNLVEVDYGFGIQEKLSQKAKEGFEGAADQLFKEAKSTGNAKLLKAVKNIKVAQQKTKQELKTTVVQKETAEDKASALMKVTDQDFKNLLSYHHQIGISSEIVDEYLNKIFKSLKKNDYEKVEVYLQKIKKENSKMNSIARLASGSGMKENATKKVRSLSGFITNYIEDDYKHLMSGGLDIIVTNDCDDFSMSFRPFDISMIIDNLLSNSKKASSRKVFINISCNKNVCDVAIEDDGKGLSKEFQNNPEAIFEAKTSTTSGAGLGLYNVRETIESIGGKISVQQKEKGLRFVMVFKK